MPFERNPLRQETVLLSALFEAMPMARVFERGKMLYHQGDKADCFYYLKRGRVRVFITSAEGTEKTLAIMEPGLLLGEAAFFDRSPRISAARALTRTEAVPVSRNTLTDMIRSHPDAALELLQMQARTIRILSDQVDSITFLPAEQRVAAFLWRLSGEGQEQTVHTTHEEIAAAVGVNRVTVSRLISGWARQGLIRTGYRQLFLPDPSAFAATATPTPTPAGGNPF